MTTQLAPHRMDLPPPSQLDLLDMGRVVGWIDGTRVGFLGFADEREVTSAAWVAYRTISRRLARRLRIRPIPIDTEPLALAKDGNREVILASGRPIATLLRPGGDSRTGPHAFGFMVSMPPPADDLGVRSMAYLIYRTLRKSGLPWALWARDTSSFTAESLSPSTEAIMSRRKSPNVGRSSVERSPVPGWERLGVLSAAILVMAFLVPAQFGLGLIAVGLGGLFVFRIAVMYQR